MEENHISKKGELELLLGPMRSNKTEELVRRVAMRRTFAHQNVMIFKPSDDIKSKRGFIESRNPKGHREMEAIEFDSRDPWKILQAISKEEERIGKKIECVAVDEGQFVEGLFSFTKHIIGSGYDALIAGLDLDFRALPFGEMIDLIWLVNTYGGNITWCIAYCPCGKRAFFSQRLIDGKPASYDGPTKVPGDSYEPRCSEHFIPCRRSV